MKKLMFILIAMLSFLSVIYYQDFYFKSIDKNSLYSKAFLEKDLLKLTQLREDFPIDTYNIKERLKSFKDCSIKYDNDYCYVNLSHDLYNCLKDSNSFFEEEYCFEQEFEYCSNKYKDRSFEACDLS